MLVVSFFLINKTLIFQEQPLWHLFVLLIDGVFHFHYYTADHAHRYTFHFSLSCKNTIVWACKNTMVLWNIPCRMIFKWYSQEYHGSTTIFIVSYIFDRNSMVAVWLWQLHNTMVHTVHFYKTFSTLATKVFGHLCHTQNQHFYILYISTFFKNWIKNSCNSVI